MNDACAWAVTIGKTGAMRFNSPPTWPAPPPGWVPPPDWHPDPTWPPPPPGWQLWVDDAPPSSKKGLIIGGSIAAALVVIIGIVVAIVLFTGGDSNSPVAKPANTEADNKQEIKDVVEKFQNAWNDSNFDGFKPITCKKAQEEPEFNESDFLDSREGSDELDLEATDFDIKGDDATVTVENAGKDPDDITFKREDGKWKWCDF